MPSFTIRSSLWLDIPRKRRWEAAMNIVRFDAGDILEMKKKHPCGDSRMRVERTGSDIKVTCLGCGREMILPRVKLEKKINRVIKP